MFTCPVCRQGADYSKLNTLKFAVSKSHGTDQQPTGTCDHNSFKKISLTLAVHTLNINHNKFHATSASRREFNSRNTLLRALPLHRSRFKHAWFCEKSVILEWMARVFDNHSQHVRSIKGNFWVQVCWWVQLSVWSADNRTGNFVHSCFQNSWFEICLLTANQKILTNFTVWTFL